MTLCNKTPSVRENSNLFQIEFPKHPNSKKVVAILVNEHRRCINSFDESLVSMNIYKNAKLNVKYYYAPSFFISAIACLAGPPV